MIRSRLARLRRADASQGSPLERRLRRLSPLERRAEARHFLEAFHDASGASATARQRRWAEVRRAMTRHGHYEHTPEELAFGARLAWRNTGRCIGRLAWESLDVADCRGITEPDGIAARMADHLKEADQGGKLRSVISIFAPVRGRVLPAWIESAQIARYACHVDPEGRPFGDRQNAEATRLARAMGWSPPTEPSPFDLLPLFVRDASDRRVMVPAPTEQIREVPIGHPERDGLSALNLRWYAVPVVSDMILTVGGIDYPCAPFNGYYMSTEIASRNLADAQRYDLLPDIALALGLDVSPGASPLWRDEALTELNRAVLHSFRRAGVTMIDHHTASDQFLTFHQREQAAGRRVAADWRWIVPPQAAAATDVFHLRMRNFHPVPNYYRDRGKDGLRLMPWRGDRYRSRLAAWVDRVARRMRLWKRMPW